jgi:hypothetical protein
MPLAHKDPVPSLPEGIARVIIQYLLQAALLQIINFAEIKGCEDIGNGKGATGMSGLRLRNVIHGHIPDLGSDPLQAKFLSNLFE